MNFFSENFSHISKLIFLIYYRTVIKSKHVDKDSN